MAQRDGFAPLSGGDAGATQGFAHRVAAAQRAPEVAGQVGARQVGHVQPRADEVAHPRSDEASEDPRIERRRVVSIRPQTQGYAAARVDKNDRGSAPGAHAREGAAFEVTVREAPTLLGVGVPGVVQTEGAATQTRKLDAAQATEAGIAGHGLRAVGKCADQRLRLVPRRRQVTRRIADHGHSPDRDGRARLRQVPGDTGPDGKPKAEKPPTVVESLPRHREVAADLQRTTRGSPERCSRLIGEQSFEEHPALLRDLAVVRRCPSPAKRPLQSAGQRDHVPRYGLALEALVGAAVDRCALTLRAGRTRDGQARVHAVSADLDRQAEATRRHGSMMTRSSRRV